MNLMIRQKRTIGKDPDNQVHGKRTIDFEKNVEMKNPLKSFNSIFVSGPLVTVLIYIPSTLQTISSVIFSKTHVPVIRWLMMMKNEYI